MIHLPLALCLALVSAHQGAPKTQTPTPAAAPAPKAKPLVKITTNYGAIVLELEPEAAPRTVENFLVYVNEGHYKGTIFHRVIQGFMIQGGGLQESMDQKPGLHPPVVNEAQQSYKAGLKNTKGTLAMARTSDPNSATDQFYINTGENVTLDFKSNTSEGIGYCVFGRVVSGMDVVEAIEKARTEFRKGQGGVPSYAVRIRNVELLPENAEVSKSPEAPGSPTAK